MRDFVSVDLSGILQDFSKVIDAGVWLKQKFEAWQSGLFDLFITIIVIIIIMCVPWAIAKWTAAWEPDRCIDPANQLHHMKFQREQSLPKCVMYVSTSWQSDRAALPHGRSVQPAIELSWHTVHGCSRAAKVWRERLFKPTECMQTSWSLVYGFSYVWTGLLGSLTLSLSFSLSVTHFSLIPCVCVCVWDT